MRRILDDKLAGRCYYKGVIFILGFLVTCLSRNLLYTSMFFFPLLETIGSMQFLYGDQILSYGNCVIFLYWIQPPYLYASILDFPNHTYEKLLKLSSFRNSLTRLGKATELTTFFFLV